MRSSQASYFSFFYAAEGTSNSDSRDSEISLFLSGVLLAHISCALQNATFLDGFIRDGSEHHSKTSQRPCSTDMFYRPLYCMQQSTSRQGESPYFPPCAPSNPQVTLGGPFNLGNLSRSIGYYP